MPNRDYGRCGECGNKIARNPSPCCGVTYCLPCWRVHMQDEHGAFVGRDLPRRTGAPA